MTDSQEETVDSQVVVFFIGFAFALHEVNTFYAIVAEQTYCIVFEQHLNLWMVQYTFLHNL